MDTEFWIRAACNGARFHQVKSNMGITRVYGDAKTTRLQQVLQDEHKTVVRGYNSLSFFDKHNNAEDVYYTFMNRFWRLAAALNRLVFRQDFSFMKASKALQALNQESK